MASFQAKIDWKMPRKREYKIYRSVSCQNRLEKAEKERKKKLSFRSIPTRHEFENSKKIAKKLKNTIVASFQAKNRLEKEGKEIK